MCLVANGTVKEALENRDNNYGQKNPTVHNTIHVADINFKNKWGKPYRETTTDKIYRLVPRKGIRMMLSFNKEDIIFSPNYEALQTQNKNLSNTNGVDKHAAR